jgi:hypothetical protein
MNKKKKIKNMLNEAQVALMICAAILLPVSFPMPAPLATNFLQLSAGLMAISAIINFSKDFI